MYRFLEVFKTLKLPEDIRVYMENVEVTRVSKTSTNSLARVYIKNDKVISKKIIYRVEDALKKQIFRIQNMDVRIIDRYVLSGQYTPQTIMDVYYDSILFELEKYWTLEYNLLKNSSWEFEKSDLLVLTLEDGFLARTYADNLTDYFKKIYLNRFGFEIDVEYKYAKKAESHYEKENAHKLNLRVKQIEQQLQTAIQKDEDGTKVEVITQISYHHQRPADKSVGKATGTDGSSFYQLASISKNQDFCGYIYADKKQAEMIMDVLESLNEIRIGYGCSSEFGAVDLKLESVEPVSVKSETCKDAVITLASDVILYNEMGMLTTDIRALEQVLRNVTGAEDLVLHNPFLRFETIGGYNVTWRRRKPVFSALGKGSAFLIHSDIGFDIGKLDGRFIGERISEGYGEILVEKMSDSADVTVRKRELSKEEPGLIEKDSEMAKSEPIQINSDILAGLLQTEFAGRMENAIRETWEGKKNKYKDSLDGLNAGIAKLRAIFKAVNSYEEMQEQVEGIEKNEKNSLCKDLIGFVNPCEVAETITEEMKASYTSEFENQWSEEETFRQAYLFYLAELKYFVKELLNSKKEGKKK